VAGYRRTDKKRNISIRQELNIFNLGEKVKEYQQNYLEHILRMTTYRILWKLFDYYPKGRRERDQPPKRWRSEQVQRPKPCS
jgi:hypothetical protein